MAEVESRTTTWKTRGNKAFREQDYAGAAKCYSEAITLEPSNHILLGNRSASFLAMSNFQGALTDANECIRLKPTWVLKLDPENVEVLERLQATREALSKRPAGEISRESDDGVVSPGKTAAPTVKDCESSESPQRKAIPAQENAAKGSTRGGTSDAAKLGNAAFRESAYPEAIKHYSVAIRETPSSYILYSNRSASYFELGQYEKALEDAVKCTELKPVWIKGLFRQGNALAALGGDMPPLEDPHKMHALPPEGKASGTIRKSFAFGGSAAQLEVAGAQSTSATAQCSAPAAASLQETLSAAEAPPFVAHDLAEDDQPTAMHSIQPPDAAGASDTAPAAQQLPELHQEWCMATAGMARYQDAVNRSITQLQAALSERDEVLQLYAQGLHQAAQTRHRQTSEASCSDVASARAENGGGDGKKAEGVPTREPPFHFEKLVRRASSPEGKQEAQRFASVLRRRGWCVVSLPQALNPEATFSGTFAAADTFFTLASEEKEKYASTSNGHGYRQGEQDEEVFESRSFFDMKYVWPKSPPGFRFAVVDSYHVLEAVALACLEIVAEALQVKPSVLTGLLDNADEHLTMETASATAIRCSCFAKGASASPASASLARTEDALLAVVPRGRGEGLHVRSLQDLAFHAVEAQLGPDEVAIFAGDTLARLTNNFFPAAMARMPLEHLPMSVKTAPPLSPGSSPEKK
eukprot:gene4039-5013_t